MSDLKQKLIEQISRLNHTARAEFLADFTEAELQQYLENLQMVWSDFRNQFHDPFDDIPATEVKEKEQVGEAVLVA